MTVLDFLQNETDKSNFDMLTIIGIDKNEFFKDILGMMFSSKYDTMSCKDFRAMIEKTFAHERNKIDYIYVYQNYILKDMSCAPRPDSERACYDGRSSYNNSRDYVVPTIIKQMQSSSFCQKHLFLLKDVLYFKYHSSGYGNDSPNQIELKIYCWINE